MVAKTKQTKKYRRRDDREVGLGMARARGLSTHERLFRIPRPHITSRPSSSHDLQYSPLSCPKYNHQPPHPTPPRPPPPSISRRVPSHHITFPSLLPRHVHACPHADWEEVITSHHSLARRIKRTGCACGSEGGSGDGRSCGIGGKLGAGLLFIE